MNSRHKSTIWPPIALMIGLVVTGYGQGIPADGSYEADCMPGLAEPAWRGGSLEAPGPSLFDWVTVRDGILVSLPGIPSDVGMVIVPSPLENTTYTVEVRFRILKCSTEERHRYSLVFVFGKREAGYHQFRAGYDKELLVESLLGLNKSTKYYATIKTPDMLAGEWMVLRCLILDTPAGLIAKSYLNGELFHEVSTTVRSSNPDWFCLRTADDNTAWELDYIRWKNAVVAIEQPLDHPMTERERQAVEEKYYKTKLDLLFENKE